MLKTPEAEFDGSSRPKLPTRTSDSDGKTPSLLPDLQDQRHIRLYGLPSGEAWPTVEQPSPDPQLRDLAAVNCPDDHYANRLFSKFREEWGMDASRLLVGLAIVAVVLAGWWHIEASTAAPGRMTLSESTERLADSMGVELEGPSLLDARSKAQAESDAARSRAWIATVAAGSLLAAGLSVRRFVIPADTANGAAVASIPDSTTSRGETPGEDPQRRPCPYCAEFIMQQATVCRFCDRDVDPVH